MGERESGMTFDEYADKYLRALTDEGRRLVQMGWNGRDEFGDARVQGGQEVEPQIMGRVYRDVYGREGEAVPVLNSEGRKLPDGAPLYTHPQPAQQGVPEGWSITHVDDPKSDGYIIRGPGINYCAWKDKDAWLYLFCEALVAAPQPEGDGWRPDSSERKVFRRALLKSAQSVQTGGDGWIKCSNRLPTRADEDDAGQIWGWLDKEETGNKCFRLTASEIRRMSENQLALACSHWKPTGLKRPQPPVEQEGKGDEC